MTPTEQQILNNQQNMMNMLNQIAQNVAWLRQQVSVGNAGATGASGFTVTKDTNSASPGLFQR